eukprot:gb/GECG01006900.1/.p1 GENE.gb/GECG01006900.1/~~gb/GECG01006900.1/.p1  ORF type:complete len:581 (+),score=41.45 gb/GECG01006900.1/:1-1743(+)
MSATADKTERDQKSAEQQANELNIDIEGEGANDSSKANAEVGDHRHANSSWGWQCPDPRSISRRKLQAYLNKWEGRWFAVLFAIVLVSVILAGSVPDVGAGGVMFVYLLVELVAAPTHALKRLYEISAASNNKNSLNDAMQNEQITLNQRCWVLVSGIASGTTLLLVFVLSTAGIALGRDLSGTEPDPFVRLGYGLNVLMILTTFIQFLEDVMFFLSYLAIVVGNYCLERRGAARPRNKLREQRTLSSLIIAKAVLAVILGVILTPISFHNADLTPEVKEVHHHFKHFPPSMDGFRLIQLSDLHVGPSIGKDNTEEVVRQANKLDADVIVLTGDIIDGTVKTFGAAVDPLGALQSRLGVYLCTGNHEYVVSVEEVAKWMDFFRDRGIRPLRNERVAILAGLNLTWSNKDGIVLYPPTASLGSTDRDLLESLSLNASQVQWNNPTSRTRFVEEPAHLDGFYVAGIEDYLLRDGRNGVKARPEKSFGNRLGNRTLIALAHQPSHIETVSKFRPELVLSGHTHGGQIFPAHLFVKLSNPYFSGLSQHSKYTQIYVNTGTNQVGPPARLGSRREITVHVLHSQK